MRMTKQARAREWAFRNVNGGQTPQQIAEDGWIAGYHAGRRDARAKRSVARAPLVAEAKGHANVCSSLARAIERGEDVDKAVLFAALTDAAAHIQMLLGRQEIVVKRAVPEQPAEPVCPRPYNNRPDGYSMAECILAGECGCTVAGHKHAKLRAALRERAAENEAAGGRQCATCCIQTTIRPTSGQSEG